MEDLDDLPTGRYYHGCLQFTDNQGEKINLVCGGQGNGGETTCHMNKVGEKSWSSFSSLPGKRFAIRGMFINGKVLMFGGRYDAWSPSNNIFEYDMITEEWKTADYRLHKATAWHGLGVIYEDFCSSK